MRRITALVALGLVLLAPACGAGDASTVRPPAALLAAAIRDREEVRSFRIAYRFELDFQLARATSTGTGVANADWTRSRMTSASSPGEDDPYRHETLVVDGRFYTRGERDDLPKGKVWVRSDVPEDAGSLMTPDEFLELVRDVPEVERAETARIRGRATTLLRAPLSGRRLDAVWDTDQIRDLVKAVTEERAPRADRLRGTAELWVGRDDRIARERVTIVVPGHGTIRLTTDYLAYGVSLASVKAPPASQVAPQAG